MSYTVKPFIIYIVQMSYTVKRYLPFVYPHYCWYNFIKWRKVILLSILFVKLCMKNKHIVYDLWWRECILNINAKIIILNAKSKGLLFMEDKYIDLKRYFWYSVHFLILLKNSFLPEQWINKQSTPILILKISRYLYLLFYVGITYK